MSSLKNQLTFGDKWSLGWWFIRGLWHRVFLLTPVRRPTALHSQSNIIPGFWSGASLATFCNFTLGDYEIMEPFKKWKPILCCFTSAEPYPTKGFLSIQIYYNTNQLLNTVFSQIIIRCLIWNDYSIICHQLWVFYFIYNLDIVAVNGTIVATRWEMAASFSKTPSKWQTRLWMWGNRSEKLGVKSRTHSKDRRTTAHCPRLVYPKNTQ